MRTTRVYLEQGSRWIFAACLDWPGWCRRAKSAELAIASLDAYRERYREIVGVDLGPQEYDVVGTIHGNATTDFGALSMVGPWDEVILDDGELVRQLDVLDRHWAYFDDVVAVAPASLAKGPRGGGRERDAVVNHVREAERAYCAKAGVRVGIRTAWPEQRTMLRSALINRAPGSWPAPYAIRRVAWHVADHAWEIEERAVGVFR